MTFTLQVLVAVLWLVPCVWTCSLVPGTKLQPPHTIQEMVYKSSIVVRALSGDLGPDHFFPASFSVLCTFKDLNNSLPASGNFSLNYDHYTSCSGWWPEDVGKEYILALKISDNGQFVPESPETNESGVFYATPDNLAKIMHVCGLQEPYGDNCTESTQSPEGDEVTDECEEAVYSAANNMIHTSAILTAILSLLMCASIY